jgi:hypothetical protein
VEALLEKAIMKKMAWGREARITITVKKRESLSPRRRAVDPSREEFRMLRKEMTAKARRATVMAARMKVAKPMGRVELKDMPLRRPLEKTITMIKTIT